MYISVKWIQNLIFLKNISLTILCEKLTLSGFEVEEISKTFYPKEINFILNVNLTANRSDILNVKGFVRELFSILLKNKVFDPLKQIRINTLYGPNLKKKKIRITCFMWEYFLQKKYFYSNKKNTITSFEGCYTFFSLETNITQIKLSPKWLQKCLTSANINPINNIWDTINFVTLETGYTFFVCDLKKLKIFLNSTTLSFSTRYALPLQKFQIERNNILTLSTDNLLLYINNIPISIIGLLTLKEIEIDTTTSDILIYGGLFDPVQIRKSSQYLGLRTQQSISLEKNLNFNNIEQSDSRLKLLFGVHGINFSQTILPKINIIQTLKKESFNFYIKDHRPLLKLNYKEVNNIRGTSKPLSPTEIISILNILHFQILKVTEKNCELYVPFSREDDIEKEIDLIEEVIRINGFNSFVSIKPKLQQVGTITKLEKLKRVLRTYFIDLGLNEVLHYTINPSSFDKELKLKNPVFTETSFFRKNLLPELITKYILNKKQKNKNYEAFEIGRTYSISSVGDVIESEFISGIFGGNFYSHYWTEEKKSINWFEAKGFIEQTFNLLGIYIKWQKIDDKKIKNLHPNRSAELLINNQIIGIFGQIHPFIAKTNSLTDDIYLFEFNLNILNSFWLPIQIFPYVPYSLYPASIIDLAFIKNTNVTFEEVKKKIQEIGAPLLESMDLFDYYDGSPIPSGYQNLGFKLKFRTFNRTLTSEEVDNIVKKIKSSLEKNFAIIIRI